MSDYQYQRFVIIGTARTGSSLLWSYLNSHPQILCLRGVLGSTNKINFGSYYQELPEEYHSTELIAERNSHPVRFIENYVFKTYPNPYKAVGFKYFYDHNRHLANKNEVINYLKTNSSIKIIHIKRENLLATLYSYKRALADKRWTSDQTDILFSDFKTEIGIPECEKYFLEIKSQQQFFDKLFEPRIFQIVYEKFICESQPLLIDLQKYLGVSIHELQTTMKQRSNIPLPESIINFEELKMHFENTEDRRYFGEESTQ